MKGKGIEFFLNLDRRWIFLIIGLAVLVPVLFPFKLPGIKPTPPVQKYFDEIENLPEGAPILVSADFDPGSKPELHPMLEATLRHAFRRKLRVVVMTLWVTGAGMVEQTLRQNVAYAKEKLGVDPQEGVDYVYLGWKSGNQAVVINLGVDLHATFSTDNYGQDLKSMEVMKGIGRLEDFNLVVSLSAGSPGFKEWVQYGVQKYDLAFNGGCTGVIIPEGYPYLQAEQMNGLLGGLKGAAEYEELIKVTGTATGGMVALSMAHFAMILLIIACNILYFLSRRKTAA